MSFNDFLGKKIIVFFSLVLISPFFSLAVDPDKNIPIRIQVNIEWDHPPKSGNTRSIGSFMLRVTGKAKVFEEDGELLRYEPVGMQAFAKIKTEDIMEDPNDKCYGKVISRIEGSGSVPITLPTQSSNGFIMDVALGHLGKIAALQQMGRAAEVIKAMMEKEEKESSNDNYTVWLSGSFNATFQSGLCDGPVNTEKDAMPFSVRIFKELTDSGMSGSYTWKSDKGLHSVDIRDFHGTKIFGPPQDGTEVKHRVSWTFGETEPIVQIWYKNKEGEEINITDKKNQDVLIGQKVKLEAVVKPAGMSLSDGEWEFDDSKIISGWEATKQKAELKPFEDHNEKQIEFCWVDGSFSGVPKKVKYSGTAEGKTVEAETTFNVFKPNLKEESIVPAGKVTVGLMPEENSDKFYCALYPGEISLDSEGQAPGNVGMFISHHIEMPYLPQDEGYKRPHLLQYVQIIKEDMLMNSADGIYWQMNNEKWCCDKNYPYSLSIEKNRTSHSIEMNDTPHQDIDKLTKELHIQDNFQTYLMFFPSQDPNDKDCVWIPLRLIKWEWAAAVTKKGDVADFDCNQNNYFPLYKAAPQILKKTDCSEHPEWSCNVENNKMKRIGTEGYSEKKWKELKAEKEKKWKNPRNN